VKNDQQGSPMNRSNWPKHIVLALLAIGVAYVLIGSVVVEVHRYRLSERAAEWVHLAEQENDASTTEDQAVRWLKGHGFETVLKGEGKRDGPEGTELFLCVLGERQLESGWLFLKPGWLRLSFVFSRAGQFLHVESRVLNFTFSEGSGTAAGSTRGLPYGEPGA
jgi:hypothetical protein